MNCSWISRTFHSSIGMKVLMAITGFMLFGFLIAHLAGNLLVFKGQDAFNTYAHGMQSLGGLLWVARGGLLLTFLAHLFFAFRLTYLNRKARPITYASKNTIQASFASLTMIYSGIVILVFVFFHLGHFTLHTVDPSLATGIDDKGRFDAHRMVLLGFQNTPVVGFYILAMLTMGLHLSHGLASLFQSLGINHPNFTPNMKKLGPVIAWALALGFVSIPVSIMLGLLSLGQGVAQ